MFVPIGVREQREGSVGQEQRCWGRCLATEQRDCLWVTGFERVSGKKQGGTTDRPRLGVPVLCTLHRGFGWILSGSAGFGLEQLRISGLTKFYLITQNWTWSS